MKDADHLGLLASPVWDGFIMILTVFVLVGYYLGVIHSNRKKHLSKWSVYRTVCFGAGVVMSAAVLAGPLAEAVHSDFRLHMLGHLLLGMLGPLLVVLSAPVTLLLRALPVQRARFVSSILRSPYFSFVSHPAVASLLNIGGLWLLYATDLFHYMHTSAPLYIIVHMHIFLAGYVFTTAMIYIDPVSRRYSYPYRAVVFTFALGAHQILSKYIYANPPAGVEIAHAEAGAMFMYYGGDLVDLIIIYILCLHWFRSTRPKQVETESVHET